MLPFLFGSLAKWLAKKPVSRAEKRAKIKSLKREWKKLQCEALEDRVTPTVNLFNNSNTLVGTYMGSAAIQNALIAAAANFRLDVNNDETYGDFIVSSGYNGLVIRRDPAASGAPVVDGNSGGSTVDINSNITVSGLRFTNSSSSNTNAILLRSGASGSTITLNRAEGYTNANGSGLRFLAGVANVSVTQNTFDGNTLGVFFVTGSGTNNNQLLNNFFTNNTSDGVRFQSGFTGTGTALHNNQFSGNGTFNLDNGSSATIDASSNWWNSTIASTIAGTINGLSSVDFSPFLNAGDYDLGTAGFQPDLSYLHVTTLGIQVGATGRIQEAVNDLLDGSLTGGSRIISVLAGTYADNVQVNKSVSILGPNAAINPNTGSRVAEAIVVPAVVETSLQSSTSGTIFRVGSGSGHVDVTIKGLTIDGHNAALSGGRTLNGVEIDTGAGIVNSIGSFDTNPGGYDAKMIVQNNIIQNLERYGVLADGVIGGTPLGGTDVSFNKIDNLPSGNNFGGGRGRAAAFEENHYGTFSFNVVTRANVGWQDDNYYLAAPGGVGTLVTGNTISSYHRGIFHNLQYATATNATITNNTLTTETSGDFPASSTNFGLELASIQSGVGATVTGNSASGHVYGIIVWNVPTTTTITVSGGTLSNNQYGVYVTNYDPQFGDGAASNVILSGLTINNSSAPGNTGIFVNDDTASTHGTMTATITGSTSITNGTTGLLISGANAKLGGNTLNNTSFTGQTGQYVTLANGAYGSPFGYIDGTGATYGGVVGSGATLAQGFAIEDKITHGTDTAGLGYVRITPNLVYVTQNSGSIQRGVNVASANDTLYITAGTFAENVSADKPLTIRGAQYGVNANSRFAAFTGGPSNPKANPAVETILTASYNDPINGNPGANDLLRTIANNITVDGLVIDGNNAAIAGASAVQFGGVDIDARRGITTVDASGNYVVTSGLKIQNNIIQNVSERGVNLDNDGNAPAVKHLVTGNVIRSFGDTGVILFWNAYTDVTNNTIDARTNTIGISSQNFFSGGLAMTWSGNTITVGQDAIGVHVNLFYDNGAALTISGNTINAATGVTSGTGLTSADDLTWGINLWSFDNTVTVNVTNNTIGSSGGQFARGINLWNITSPAVVTVSGGTVGNSRVGINMDATDPYYSGGDGIASISNVAITGGDVGIRVRSRQLPYAPLGGGSDVDPAGNVRLNISGGSITGATIGVLVEDSFTDAYTASAQFLGGTTISGATIGISITGAQTSLVGNTLANTIFTGITGDYVTLASGALGSPFTIIDGTSVNYNGIVGNAASLAQGFAIENKITHGTDTAGLGYVRITPNIVYVTASSGSIQRGINVATPGDTIDVQAGTYKENLTVNKGVSLVGPNSALAGNAVRGAEAIIMTNGNQNAVVTVTADNVSIMGFLVTGDDTAVTGQPVYSGADANAYFGITNGNHIVGTPINNLTVQNNIVQRVAIGFLGNSLTGGPLTISTGNTIDSNLFQDIGVYDFGYAVSLRNEFNANVTNNVMKRVYTGVSVNNNSLAAPAYRNVTGNTIQSYANGLWDNQAYSSATPLNVANNNFTEETQNYLLNPLAAVANNIGILVTGGPGFVGSTFSNNTITDHDYGLVVWGTDPGITFGTGNSINNAQIGVYVTNNVGFNPIGTTALNLVGTNASVNLTGLAINNVTSKGIWVRGDTGGGTATVTLSGTTISAASTTAAGITIDGVNAVVAGATLANTQFTGFTSANNRFVNLTNGAYNGPAEIDGASAMYNGVAGGNTLSLPNAFSIEDKINDYLDLNNAGSANVGFVRLRAGHIYVTQNSDSIQRGVNAASSGDFLYVSAGTFAEAVTVNKPLTIRGAQYGVNANTRFAAFVTGVDGPKANPAVETVLTAAATDPSNPVNDTLHIMADNITVDGLVVDGNNPSLAQGGATVIGGINTDSRRGIQTEDAAGNFFAVNNLTLQNNIVQNFSQRGIQLINPTGTSPATSGNLITGNVIRNIGQDSIRLQWNAYSDVTNNTIVMPVNGEAGIWMQDFSNNGLSPKTVDISNNNVTVSQDAFGGIWANLIYAPNATINIHDNTVNAAPGVTGASDYTFGIYLSSLQGGTTATLTNNTVGSAGGEFARGISLWNLPTTVTTTVTGGSVGNSLIGVSVHYNDPNFGGAGASTVVNLSNISVSAVNEGVLVEGVGTPFTTRAQLSGLTINGSATGIHVNGTTASLVGNTLSNTIFSGITGNYVSLTNSAGNGPVEIDGTGASYNGVAGGNTLSLSNGFAIEDKINDYLDKDVSGSATVGFVRLRSGHVYVTQLSDSIQRGVDVALANETVHVNNSTIIEDVVIGTTGVKLVGAGPGNSTISGAIGGSGSTIAIAASNVLVDGFTITREGNAVATWNAALNTAGISIQGLGITNAEIRNNNFFGNRTGIDINNSGGHSIHNNVINDNRTGMVFRNQTDNISVYQNSIANNWTVGVLFLDGSGGTNTPPQQAVGSTFFNNNISGNWYGQVVDRQTGGSLPAPGTNVKNFSGNWFGSITPVITNANSTEPGYAALIPVAFGGTSTPPGGQPDIAGPGSANIDISPYLNSGIDTDPGTYGFQGDFSNLWVTSQLAQTGSTSRIQEGYDLVVDPAGPAHGLVHILGGSYTGDFLAAAAKDVDLSPGTSPAQVTVNGNFTLNTGITLVMEINGTSPGTGYDQFVVTGSVTLGNATLNATRDPSAFIPTNTAIRLIDKTSGGPISGLFNGISEGSVLTLLNIPFTASYVGGTGNDFTLTVAPPTDVWVNGNWLITTDTGAPGLTPGDIVSTTGGQQLPISGLVYGYNAYSTIQAGINNVVTSGTVHVVSGTYSEDITIDKPLSLIGPNVGINPNTGSRIAEAIIHPATQNADFSSPTTVPNIYITASGVSIDGLTVDGDNSSLTSGYLVNGVDVDSYEAIASYEGVGNINVQNNIILNQTYAGVDFYNYSNSGAATGDNYLRHNKIDNVGYIPGGFGIGILVYNNFYAAIDDNVMTAVRVGVQTGNFFAANPGMVAPSISNNDITTQRIGIYHNLQYSNASPFTISNNIISAAKETGSPNPKWWGIALTSIQNAVGVTVSNNTINATAFIPQPKIGYVVWNTPTTNTITISGGSVTGAGIGILAANAVPGSYGDADSSSVIVSGVTISGSTIAGIKVNDDPSNGNGASVAVTVTGNTTVSGSPTGILVSGSDASANINNNLSSIYGNVIGIDVNAGTATITSNSIYNNGTGIRFTNGGSGSVTGNNFLGPITNFLANDTDLRLDSTAGAVTMGAANLFGGGSSSVGQFANPIGYYIDNRSSQNFNLVGSSSTFNRSNGTTWAALSTGVLADNFRIEDRLYHALDNATSGLIRIVANTLYVTTPGTGASNETIQRGVNAASTGDTIRVEAGTYAENVIVDEEVTIWGAGQGSTIVVPSFVGANTGGGSLAPGASSIFLVRSNNVTIRNLTADGDNTLLPGGVLVNGANVDARNGIITDHINVATVLNLNVHDVTVQNIYLRGIYASTGGGTFTFNNNIVQNVAADPASIGIFNFGGSGTISNNQVSLTNDGISANHSMGTNFLGNTISTSGSGIHTDNAGDSGGVPDLIQGNTVQNGPANSYGIFVFVPYNNVQISNNIVNNVDVGLGAFAGAGGSATFTNNQVDVASRAGSLGAWVSTTAFGFGSGSVSATFTGNTIKNGSTLLLVEQENASDDFSMMMLLRGPSVNVSEPATATQNSNPSESSSVSYLDSVIDNATLTDAIPEGNTGKDVLSDSDPMPVSMNNSQSLMTPVTATVVLNGNSFDNSATSLSNTIGIDVNGGTVTMNTGNQIIAVETGLRMDAGTTTVALIGNTLSNLSFSGVTGNYITLKNGALDNQEINGTGVAYNGVLGSGASTSQGFAIEDKIQHAVDAATLGFIRVRTGQVYVTPNSFAPSEGTSFADIQRGVDAAIANDTVWVQAGLYDNDVNVNKAGLSLIGEGYATTTIRGVVGNGNPSTVSILANNVTVAGFTITRNGNTNVPPGTWLANDQNQGINMVGGSGAVIRDNRIIGNRNGLQINNAQNVTIRNNIITENRTGVQFNNNVNGLLVTENYITNNWTDGILFNFDAGLPTTISPIITNNSITGNWYAGIERRWTDSTVIIDASGNWFGTNNPTFVVNNAGNAGEPGYAAQIPATIDGVPVPGGSATNPGGAPDILDSRNNNLVDFTPFLWTGTDTNSGAYADTNGFQGDFSNLGVTTAASQAQAISRIQEAYNLLPALGGTIHILAGTYAGNVATGIKPAIFDLGTPSTTAQITINGSLTLTPTVTINFNLSGPNVSTPVGGTDYDQIVTTGATDVGGAIFNITKNAGYFPNVGANFALIRSTPIKTGSFNYGGLVAENAIIAVGGINFKVNYNLGSGPFDLNLGVVIPNNIVYVWNGWSGQSLGDYYQSMPPTSTLAAPPGGYATFTGDPVTYGYNAFSTIQSAINAVSSGSIIRIYIGTYTEDITVSSGKNNLQLVAFGATGTRTINGVVGGPSATISLQGTGTIFSGNSAIDNFVVNQTAADNLAGIRTSTGSLGSTVSYVNVSGSNNATNFTGVDVGAGTWVNYSNGAISNYRTGIKVNNNAGTVANPVNVQTSTINGAGWASLTIAPVGVDVGLNGYASLTNNNAISGNRWGVRVLGGTAMLQGNNLSGNNHMGASAAGLFVANGGVVDAGQVIDGSELNYTGLGISTGGNNFATGYAMNSAQAIVNLNANFGGSPSGTGNLTDGTNVSARNNNFGTAVYGNIEQVVNHAIDNNFQGYVDYRNAIGVVAPLQEGATTYYALSPNAGEVTTQRSMIRGIQFVFDSPVIIDSSAISLIRSDGTNPSNPATFLSWYGHSLPNGAVPLTFTSTVSGLTGRTTVNITFTNSTFSAGYLDVLGGSLVDGLYARNVNTSLTDLLFSGSGVKVNSTLGTGGVNSVANANYKRLFGDFNGDGAVTAFDSARFNSAFSLAGSPFARYFDYNNSGVVAGDLADQAEFNKRIGFLLT